MAKEVNSYKILYFVNCAIAFLFLFLLAITPNQQVSNQFVAITLLGNVFNAQLSLALAYMFFFIGGLVLVIIDLVVSEDEKDSGELFDTITVETGQKYLFQAMGYGVEICLAVSIISGTLLGAYYYGAILAGHPPFLFVPSFFSASPLGLLTAQQYDAVVSSFGVANVEELIFIGIQFSMLFALILNLMGYLKLDPRSKGVLIAALIAAVLINGYLAAFIFHAFVYGAVGYAYEDAQRYFSASSLIAGLTGTIVGGVIAHTIHNIAAKLAQKSGSYQVLGQQFRSGFQFTQDQLSGDNGTFITIPVEK